MCLAISRNSMRMSVVKKKKAIKTDSWNQKDDEILLWKRVTERAGCQK